MTVVSVRLPNDLVLSIDKTALAMNRSRAEVIRKAVELYLARAEQLWSTLDRISPPETLAFNWEDVETSLLTKD
jgi:RHH-type rel operon transcriptional repressor/antitoxin RelB